MEDGSSEEKVENTLNGKYLSFLLGQEMYGIEIQHITEIVGLPAITEMPDMPVHIKGKRLGL